MCDCQWRDIETAPRDRPLLGCVNGHARIVRWGKTSHVPMFGWRLADQGVEEFDLCDPTHWMPLPQAPTTAPAAAKAVEMDAQDLAILEAVRREMDEDDGGNAPGHAHSVVGIWDDDNGEKAGKPCAWCLTWTKFTTLIDAALSKQGGNHG